MSLISNNRPQAVSVDGFNHKNPEGFGTPTVAVTLSYNLRLSLNQGLYDQALHCLPFFLDLKDAIAYGKIQV